VIFAARSSRLAWTAQKLGSVVGGGLNVDCGAGLRVLQSAVAEALGDRLPAARGIPVAPRAQPDATISVTATAAQTRRRICACAFLIATLTPSSGQTSRHRETFRRTVSELSCRLNRSHTDRTWLHGTREFAGR
jgi:hypothetical protein